MIGSGEAESRAVAGAVKGAVSQVRLDAAVNIAGLLIDIDRADGVDCRQYFMCWHLTRILGPSLTEMVPPAVVRSVVNEDTAPPRIAAPNQSRCIGSPPATTPVQMHYETPDWPELDGDGTTMVNDDVDANDRYREKRGYLCIGDRQSV